MSKINSPNLTLRIRKLPDLASIEAQRESLCELSRQSASAGRRVTSFFQDVDWVLAWWRAFSSELLGRPELCAFIFEVEGRCVGFVPLVLEKRQVVRRSRSVLSFAGASNFLSDYCDALLLPEVDVEQAARLFANALLSDSSWSLFDWTGAPEQSPFKKAVVQALGQGEGQSDCWIRYSHSIDCPRIDFGAMSVEEREKSHAKTSMKRKRKALESKGVLEFRHLESAEEISKHLETFFKQHEERWIKGKGKESAFRSSSQRAFFKDVSEKFRERGWLRFGCLSLSGEPIAYHLGFSLGQQLLWYKPAFDVNRSSDSPGEVLLSSLLKYCVDQKLGVFDFTVGPEAFKYRHANRIEKVERWWIGRSNLDRALLETRLGLSRAKTILQSFFSSRSKAE